MDQALQDDGVPFDDRGLLLGDGLFETLLWNGGRLILGEAHGERMVRGAAVLGLPAPSLTAFLDCAGGGAAKLGTSRGAVRVTLTAGSGGRGVDRPAELRPRLFASAAPSAKPDAPATLHIASVRRNAGSPASRLKTLAYLDNVLARREAAAAGAHEAVMLNTSGHVACAAVANLFWVRGEALHTPPAEAGCLDGTMRALVIAAAADAGVPVRYSLESQDEFARADAWFLTSSLIGVRPARLRNAAKATTHPLVERLAAAVAPYA